MDIQQYPDDPTLRSQWVVKQRPQRNHVERGRPYAFFVEEERSASGEIVPVATIFLTNRECPWRCVMCDLWKNTLPDTIEQGAIPRQIRYALDRLPPARQIKLYNSGSFFDLQAIPEADYEAIADLVRPFERVIVECHPALIGDRCFGFQKLLSRPLEVAMGLETVHPDVLQRLNKRMTLDQYQAAADALRSHSIDLRAFILLQPPFMKSDETLTWAQRSVDFAFACEATAVSLIPTRGGNGAMETLAKMSEFAPPSLASLEAAVQYGLGLSRGRVFADLWDLRQTTPKCPACWRSRLDRLAEINLAQQISAAINCTLCGGLS